jgi:hypothetical protein
MMVLLHVLADRKKRQKEHIFVKNVFPHNFFFILKDITMIYFALDFS